MNLFLILLLFLDVLVVLAWFYAYHKLRVGAFAFLGAAFLVLFVERVTTQVTSLLRYYKVDPILLIRVYGAFIDFVVGFLFVVLAVYGIIKLIRFYEKGTREAME